MSRYVLWIKELREKKVYEILTSIGKVPAGDDFGQHEYDAALQCAQPPRRNDEYGA